MKISIFLFNIEQQEKKLYFRLNDLDGNSLSTIEIPYPESFISDDSVIEGAVVSLPPIPKGLRKLLESHPEYEIIISQIREKILLFDQDMGERSNVATKYGLKRGNSIPDSKLCAEIYPVRYNDKLYCLSLSLWLPYCKEKRKIIPLNKTTVKFAFKIEPTDIHQEVLRLELFRSDKPTAKPNYAVLPSQYWQVYTKLTGLPKKDNTVESFIDLSLQQWLERLNTKYYFAVSDGVNFLDGNGDFTADLENTTLYASREKCLEELKKLPRIPHCPYCKCVKIINDQRS